MYQNITFDVPAQEPAHRDLSMFLLEHAQELVSAARLLGGVDAVRRTAETIEGVTTAAVLTNRHKRRLQSPFDLLSLENVDVPDSVEAAQFAEIDPGSPVVEEICLMTDRLAELLVGVEEADSREAAQEAA